MQQRVGLARAFATDAADPADGRAVLGARSADPQQAAGRTAGAAGAGAQDDPVRHPRPRRGAEARQPDLGARGRPHRADRHARGHRAAPGQRLRRRVRAAHEPAVGAERPHGDAAVERNWRRTASRAGSTRADTTPRRIDADGKAPGGRVRGRAAAAAHGRRRRATACCVADARDAVAPADPVVPEPASPCCSPRAGQCVACAGRPKSSVRSPPATRVRAP